MKVCTPCDGERTIFAVYSVGGKEYYLYVPYEEYNGLLAIDAGTCMITNSDKKDFIVDLSEDWSHYSFHVALQSTDLLERVIDHEQIASDTFRRNLKSLGEII